MAGRKSNGSMCGENVGEGVLEEGGELVGLDVGVAHAPTPLEKRRLGVVPVMLVRRKHARLGSMPAHE